MAAVAAIVPLLEIIVVCLGLFIWLRNRSILYSVSAALSLGMMSGLGLLSCVLQIGFLIGQPRIIPVLELGVVAGLIWLNRQRWQTINDIPKRLSTVGQAAPITVSILAIALIYLLLQAVLLPPSSWDSMTYHLPRVLQWQQNHTLFLRDFTISPQATFPVGADILFHLFLRLPSDYGLGIFSWLSYLIILFGTYALARPRVSQNVALTTAVVIACLPELVYQSTTTKNDIVLAAVALACVVWADRWLRKPSIDAALGLGLTLCFGVAIKTSFVLFGFFFMVLWFSLVIQRGYFGLLISSLVKHWRAVLICLLPAFVLSQAWLFFDNYRQYGGWLGPNNFVTYNQNNDGLFGAVANLIRYGFQSIHFLQPFDWGVQYLSNGSMQSGLQAIYDRVFEPWLGQAGFARTVLHRSFEIKWRPHEDNSWFGPVSVFLVFPAVGWTLLHGKRLSRVMALVSLCLVGAICYKIGWSPWKTRFFSIVFVCTGPCVAMFLNRSQARAWRLTAWRWLSLAILTYACLYNTSKPIVSMNPYLDNNDIWTQSNWTRDRMVYSRAYQGDRVESMSQALTSAKRVAIVGYDHYFPLMYFNPQLEFLFLQPKPGSDNSKALASIADRLEEVDHLICYDPWCDSAGPRMDLKLIWENDPEFKLPQIYEVHIPGLGEKAS